MAATVANRTSTGARPAARLCDYCYTQLCIRKDVEISAHYHACSCLRSRSQAGLNAPCNGPGVTVGLTQDNFISECCGTQSGPPNQCASECECVIPIEDFSKQRVENLEIFYYIVCAIILSCLGCAILIWRIRSGNGAKGSARNFTERESMEVMP